MGIVSKSNPQPMTARYLGVDRVEALYGISRWTVRRWAYDGKIGSVKMGRRLMIPVSELDRLVTEGTRPAVKQ